MKLDNVMSNIKKMSQPRDTYPLKEKGKTSQKADTSLDSRMDKVSFSPSSIEEARTASIEELPSTTDLRAERIGRLKNQIQSGTYTPDPARIAKAMFSVHQESMI